MSYAQDGIQTQLHRENTTAAACAASLKPFCGREQRTAASSRKVRAERPLVSVSASVLRHELRTNLLVVSISTRVLLVLGVSTCLLRMGIPAVVVIHRRHR